MKSSSLTYLETELLHPTRSARFASARRLRLTHRYAILGQAISSVSLIAWALTPVFFAELSGNRVLAFLGVITSIYMLAVTLMQQGANYIDRARSLEGSARRIDSLRREVQASIMNDKDLDSAEFGRLSSRYSEILEENPINHQPYDLVLASSKPWTIQWLGATAILHIRAGASFLVCLFVVIVVPLILVK